MQPRGHQSYVYALLQHVYALLQRRALCTDACIADRLRSPSILCCLSCQCAALTPLPAMPAAGCVETTYRRC